MRNLTPPLRLTALALCSLALATVPKPAQAQTNDFDIKPTESTTFTFGGKNLRIWESLKNQSQYSNNPELWQFRYEPIFAPEIGSDGNPVFSKTTISSTDTRLSLKIYFSNSNASAKALAAVQTLYPALASSIGTNNVAPLKVASITNLAMPDLSKVTGTTLTRTSIDTSFSPDPFFKLSIDVSDATRVPSVKALFQDSFLQFNTSFSAKQSVQNAVSVQYSDLRNSQLYVDLTGLGSSTYVQRDDLRKLCEDIKRHISVVGVIEDPDRFDNDIFNQIFSRLTTGISTTAFTNLQWQSTYAAADLKPDIIEKQLNKIFTYDSSTSKWASHTGIDASASGAYGVISGEAAFKGQWDESGMLALIAQHDITAQVEGHLIKPKSLNVRQLNMSQFNQTGSFTSVLTYVTAAVFELPGSVTFSGAGTVGVGDLSARLADLENAQQLTVGTITAFTGLKTSIPSGWLICDGQSISSSAYPRLYSVLGTRFGSGSGTFTLPDMRGRFLRGVDGGSGRDPDNATRTAAPGGSDKVGSTQADAMQSHKHDDSGHDHSLNLSSERLAVTLQTDGRPMVAPGGNSTGTGFAVLGDPTDSGTGAGQPRLSVETRPKNMAVYWLIKAK